MTASISARTRSRCHDFARRHHLPPETVDHLMALVHDHVEALGNHRRTMITRWADRVRADPEIGRNAFPAAIRLARQAVERFGGERLKKVLDDTDMGSHPEIVRAFYKVGKAMPPESTGGAHRQRSHEEVMRAMYPSMYGTKI